MAKNAVELNITANTKDARKQIASLSEQTQKLTTPKGKFNLDFSAAQKGLANMGAKIGEISPALGKLAGAFGASAAPLAVAGASAALLAKGLADSVENGKEAQREFEQISVSLGTISRNLTGAGNADGLTAFIQEISANGVNAVSDLASASKTLLVAFRGNQTAVKDFLPALDDLAAGTGQSVDSFASLIAKVRETGVDSKSINALAK